MFEKEAQEWVKTHTKIENKESYVELKGPSAIKSFEAGAEFGYNKCKEELNQKGLALQSDMDKTIEQNIALKKELNKANEWHFVSKDGFPNKDDIYLIIRSDGLHLGDYCCGGNGDIDCQSWCDYPSEEEIQDNSVIAWKEITLPEEE